MQPHRRQPTRLPHPWVSPGKNTGVGCHFLLQCMKVKSESEVSQSCPTLSDPMDCSLPGSSVHGIFQARVLERGCHCLLHQQPAGGRKCFPRVHLILKHRFLCYRNKQTFLIGKNVFIVMLPILINKDVSVSSYNDLKFMVQNHNYVCTNIILAASFHLVLSI